MNPREQELLQSDELKRELIDFIVENDGEDSVEGLVDSILRIVRAALNPTDDLLASRSGGETRQPGQHSRPTLNPPSDGDTRPACNEPECLNDWPCSLHSRDRVLARARIAMAALNPEEAK